MIFSFMVVVGVIISFPWHNTHISKRPRNSGEPIYHRLIIILQGGPKK